MTLPEGATTRRACSGARLAGPGVALAILWAVSLPAAPASAQQGADAASTGTGTAQTVDVGPTGWDARRPVMASACPEGCPWGELGEFVRDALAPLGYEVVLCRNCNRDRGPRLVSTAARPPELDALDAATGTSERVDAPVDFGVTASGLLASAYRGEGGHAAGGPYANLRLIAKIEDPTYLLVAVRRETGITDLSQIADRRMPVRVLAGGGADQVLAYYGLNREVIEDWGGSVGRSMGAQADAPFDVVIDDLGTSALNPEGAHWTRLSQAHDLAFLDLPEPLVEQLSRSSDYRPVTTKWGLLRGADHPIRTVGRSGEAVFARADTPEQAAYDVARAIDQARGELIWLIRPYSLDPRTVMENQGVPLHPGAERYYRESGYIR